MIRRQTIDNVLSRLQTDLVLIDVGASGAPPDLWKKIARQSIYVGFDPDLREMRDVTSRTFKRQIIINKAVTNGASGNAIKFYLTRSPFCSSTLLPRVDLLSQYLYSDLFDIVGETTTIATTLNTVLGELSLPVLDWLKLDTQGTDLSIINSLHPETLAQVLALDVEPGLQQNYTGEDTFSEVHQTLLDKGFWLSDMAVRGAVRMRPTTMEHLQNPVRYLSRQAAETKFRPSPMWVEARYFRTFETLPDSPMHQRNLVILWLFSLLDNQLGYALDIAVEYERRYGQDFFSPILQSIPLETLSRITPMTSLKALIPKRIKRWIKSRIR